MGGDAEALMGFLLIFGPMVLFGVLCGAIAKTKGRDVAAWAVCGFLFPLITFIVALIVPDLKQKAEQERAAEARLETEHKRRMAEIEASRLGFDPREMKLCPFCAEPIRKQAIKCRHCGATLD